jgi:hypothetical protein
MAAGARKHGLKVVAVTSLAHDRATDNGAPIVGLSREEFFSNGQPSLRSSPLTKRYGWGVHANSDGKVALLAIESDEYAALVNDPGISHLQAMRSSRK